jgi:hypothetical protein
MQQTPSSRKERIQPADCGISLQPLKGNIMNAIKLLSAAALLVAASTSAFASGEDGKSDNAWLAQTPISQVKVARQAPAPAASAAAKQDNSVNAGNQFESANSAVMP